MDRVTLFRLRYAELKEFLGMITDELASYNTLTKAQPDSQFIRRLRVRTVFACIEAHISHLKASALVFFDEPEKEFSRADFLGLQDIDERKDTNGVLRRLPARLTIKENASLAFRAFAKVAGTKNPLDFSGVPGRTFLGAVDVRDRIIHPKSKSQWYLSDADAELVQQAWLWFGKNLVAVSAVPNE